MSYTLKVWPKSQLFNRERSAVACDSFMASVPHVAFVAILFLILIYAFHFWSELNEGDLYRVIMGLLNGEATGLGLNDPTQYGIRFGYGYVTLVYWLGELHMFAITQRAGLIEAINTIGFIACFAIVAFLMPSLCIMYGARTALLASTIFLFSPLFLELATSGHQLLIALAFFFSANLILLLDVEGWWKILCYAAAALLLFVGLTMRAELPLAFPWLVFAERSAKVASVCHYFRDVIARSIVCLFSFAAFQIAFQFYVHTPPAGDGTGSISAFIGHFYSLQNVMRGVVILVIGAGVATAVAGVAAFLLDRTRIVQGFRSLDVSALNLVGPLGIVIVGLTFWIPNPNPARHFTFLLLGLAVLIALSITHCFRVNRVGAIAIGLAIVIANQALAEVVRPIVLRNLHSPYIRFPEHNPTTGAVPLGSFLRHHFSLAERMEVLVNFGRMVAGSCEPRLLVLTSNGPLMAGLMFKPQSDTRVALAKVGPYNALKLFRDGQTFIFMDPLEVWPRDPVSVILEDKTLNSYQMLRDPYSISKDDKLAVPVGRIASYPQSDSEMHCDGNNERIH